MGAEIVIERLTVGALGANCYLVVCPVSHEMMVVDPGDEAERILARIRERDAHVAKILHTHGHFDHIGATEAVQAGLSAPVPLLAHPADEYLYARDARQWGAQFGYPLPAQLSMPDSTIADGMVIAVGTLQMRVIATPGHTPGSVCLLLNDEDESASAGTQKRALLLSGDTLFRRGIGRTDLSGGDEDAIYESILTQLYALPNDVHVYPGHGDATTIGEEKRANPFVRGA